MADIGELATFMWNVAGAPPNSTGAPGLMTWAIVMPASTSTVWKTVAPTVVTGAIRPISVTGTISTGMPASTQSIRFWQESSLYRKLPVAVIVKIDIGRAMRSARSARKSCIISTMRGDAVLGERARDDRLLRVRQRHVQAPRVGHLRLDVVVGREGRREIGDVLEAVGQADVFDEVGRVREADLAGPVVEHLEPGRARHEVDAVAAEVGVRAAVAGVERERARGVGDGPLDDVPREQHAVAGGVGRQPGLEQPPAHLRAADLHADLGQHALGLVDDPVDEFRARGC